MNLVFWVINSLGPIAFSELSNIGNSIVISIFSGIINLASTVFNIIKWLLKAEKWVREVCVLSSFHPNPTLPTEMLTLVFCIVYTYARLTSLYCLHLWQKCFLSLCLYTFFSSLIITPSFHLFEDSPFFTNLFIAPLFLQDPNIMFFLYVWLLTLCFLFVTSRRLYLFVYTTMLKILHKSWFVS